MIYTGQLPHITVKVVPTNTTVTTVTEELWFNKHSSYHGYRGDSGKKLRKQPRSPYNHTPLIQTTFLIIWGIHWPPSNVPSRSPQLVQLSSSQMYQLCCGEVVWVLVDLLHYTIPTSTNYTISICCLVQWGCFCSQSLIIL